MPTEDSSTDLGSVLYKYMHYRTIWISAKMHQEMQKLDKLMEEEDNKKLWYANKSKPADMNRQSINPGDYTVNADSAVPTQPGILSNYIMDHEKLCYMLSQTVAHLEAKVFQFTGSPEATGEPGKTGPVEMLPLAGALGEGLQTLRVIGMRLEAVKNRLDLL